MRGEGMYNTLLNTWCFPTLPPPPSLSLHSSTLTPHSSPLTLHSSTLSSLLTPNPSLLTAHSSPLTPHSPHPVSYFQQWAPVLDSGGMRWTKVDHTLLAPRVEVGATHHQLKEH